jgi:hypothetical protein
MAWMLWPDWHHDDYHVAVVQVLLHPLPWMLKCVMYNALLLVLCCCCCCCQASELMQQWAPIEVADALELLSPDFKNDEVRAHAVATLQAKDDDELLYYLLQVTAFPQDVWSPRWLPVYNQAGVFGDRCLLLNEV